MNQNLPRSGEADREFVGLLWDLSEGGLSEQASSRLNDLLLHEPGRRRTLVQFMQLIAGLEWEHSGLAGKAPEAVARAWCGADVPGELGIDQPPIVDGLGGLASLASGVEPPGARSPIMSTSNHKAPLIFSIAEWLQPRQIITVSRAAAAVSLVATLLLGVVGAAAITMGVMKSQSHASQVVPKNSILGSHCVGRAERDMAKGTVCFVRNPTTVSGRATSFSFYNVHADDDRWITPIILALDPTSHTYRITGIGQPVLNLGSGVQTVPFQLIVGSADLQAGVHTFGFYHGTVDKTGRATKPSLGPLDFDHAPESTDDLHPLAAEARWLFVPALLEDNPVALRLDLEFSLEPKSGQIQLWQGDEGHSKERVYSGQLEIVHNNFR